MKPNQIKIVSNNKGKKLSYFFQNEKSEWNLVSNTSALSRKKYASASISENATEILQIINDTYNVGNRGVNIFFDGNIKDYHTLQNIIEEKFSDSHIQCYQQKTSIAVAGKIASGKTTLIREILKRQGKEFRFFQNNMIDGYVDTESTITWYEIPGIDFGKEHVLASMANFDFLAKSGVTDFIYCFGTNKVEELEEQYIRYVQENYPAIKILIVLTKCLEDESAPIFSEQLFNSIGNVKVIPTLAKEFKTREGSIPAYGLEEIVDYIFEGKMS